MSIDKANKRRITIEVYGDDISDHDAISAVRQVMKWGKKSVAAKGKKHYCFHTEFSHGISVSARLKYNTDNDNFAVYTTKRQ